MEFNLTPEVQEKLNSLAIRTNRGTDELLVEAIEQFVSYNEWLEEKVRISRESIDRDGLIPDEEVLAWVESRERRQHAD